MKKYCLLFFLLLAFDLLAHEFWLQPDKFIYKTGELINIKFLVGENFDGENWNGNNLRIKNFKLYLPEATDDLVEHISEQPGDFLQVAIYDEGTAMFTFNSTNSYIELEAAKFNEYLIEDNLLNAIAYRNAHNETEKAGKEFYQRSVKTLIQIGKIFNDVYKQTTELPLDIVPLENPYELKKHDSLSIKVLFEKKPLPNTHIVIWNRVKKKIIKNNFTTNQNGEVRFPVNTEGIWMVSTVKMIHLKKNEKADWQSYWGSLTWGYTK